MTKCKHCKREIDDFATRCPYCTSELTALPDVEVEEWPVKFKIIVALILAIIGGVWWYTTGSKIGMVVGILGLLVTILISIGALFAWFLLVFEAGFVFVGHILHHKIVHGKFEQYHSGRREWINIDKKYVLAVSFFFVAIFLPLLIIGILRFGTWYSYLALIIPAIIIIKAIYTLIDTKITLYIMYKNGG